MTPQPEKEGRCSWLCREQHTYEFGCELYRDPSPNYDSMVVGPADVLVLVSKKDLTADALAGIAAKIPASAKGRVLVVDGSALDVKVVRNA